MADISQIQIGETAYGLSDSQARQEIESLQADGQELSDSVDELKNGLNASGLISSIPVVLTWEAGSFNNNGDERPTAGFIRTAGRTPVPAADVRYTFILGHYTGTIGYIGIWDVDGNWTGERTAFRKGEDQALTLPAGGSFRITIGPASGSADVLDPADGNTVFGMTYAGVANVLPDGTLSAAGRPAEAKAVGDAVSELESGIGEINGILSGLSGLEGFDEPIPVNWQKGNISGTGTNSDSASLKIMRTATPWAEPSFSTVCYEVPEGYVLRVFIRDSAGTKKSDTSGLEGNGSFDLAEGDRFRLTMQLSSGGDIDIQTAGSLFKLYGKTPLRDKLEAVAETVDRNTALSYINFSIFENFGVIGDSFASGSLHHPDDGRWTGNYRMSWPQILARKTGSAATNFTAGGKSAKTWLADSTHGLPALLSAPAQQLYIIALGINDNTQINAGTLTLGTIDDVNVADYTQNPDTFFGCYGRIIGNIMAHAPYAKIVCLSVARLQERGMDPYIQQIAEKYGLPFIDLTSDPYFTSAVYYGSMVDSHPLVYGYAGMANAIERLILLDVLNNKTYWGTYYGLTAADTSGQPDE